MFAVPAKPITDSCSDGPDAQGILFSSSDEDDLVPVDRLAVMLDDDIRMAEPDPGQQVPDSDRARFISLWKDGRDIARLGQSTTLYPWKRDRSRMIMQRMINSGELKPLMLPAIDQIAERKRERPRTTAHSDRVREAIVVLGISVGRDCGDLPRLFCNQAIGT
jgi:hypothetical protein